MTCAICIILLYYYTILIKWVYIQIHIVYNVTTCLQHKDLLQLMIDASDRETQKKLVKEEIIVESVGLMLGGYETTSTTLAFATYLLAANPEAQKRLANEIHEYFEENPVSKSHVLCIEFLLGVSLKELSSFFCLGQVNVRCLT